jgi:hypothetical protein
MPQSKLQQLAQQHNWNKLQIKGACQNLKNVVRTTAEMQGDNLIVEGMYKRIDDLERDLLWDNGYAWYGARDEAIKEKRTAQLG